MGGSSEEKDLPASDKKIRDARNKGQTAKSTEFVTAAVTLTSFCYLIAQFGAMTQDFIDIIQSAGDAAGASASTSIWTSVRPLTGRIEVIAATILVPQLLLAVLSAVAASVAATGGPVLSFEPLMPKLDSLNPINGFKKMFGIRKLFDLLKNIAKLIVIGVISIMLIRSAFQPLVEQPSCGLTCAPGVVSGTMMPLFMMGGILFVIIGIADIALQKWLFMRDQRMTKTEMKQETKNSEGDPVMKAAHKRAQREAANSRIGLKQATFGISGTNIFVAMRYSTADTRVPTLVARGEAEKAGELLQEARKQQLPLSYDAEAARTVFDQVKLGMPVSKDLFQVVIGVMKTLNMI